MESVAIIILNWNSYKDTFDCLKSIEKLDYDNYHVFLVDNFSQDNSLVKLEKDYIDKKFQLNLTFVKMKANLGFAGGNNVAIKIAAEKNYKYIWMLNNDTIVDQNALKSLVVRMNKNENIGIVGSKIYYYNSNKIWFAGGQINKHTGSTKHIGIREEDKSQYNSFREVDYITGCSLLFRKEVVDSTGYMSDDYFLYYEETDWNIRAKANGWLIYIEPKSVVYHKVSVSSGGENNIAPYVDYYDIRNAYICFKRNRPKYLLSLAFIYMMFKAIKKHIRIFVKNQNRKFERSFYIIRGLKDALHNNMGKHPNIEKNIKHR
ncbi:glycosyltransferase family 2 protein [Priestia megaterium]|uniref:glycosyltransferase family 2 protein n=1 Tax=Priestia megaterium TaxID=1404 RepID=UPI0018903374|nr:glycosyltransferase family 2 protein [Priestia megaterium]